MIGDKITKHDWVIDFDDEDNGKYYHVCTECGAEYLGHKRRIEDKDGNRDFYPLYQWKVGIQENEWPGFFTFEECISDMLENRK